MTRFLAALCLLLSASLQAAPALHDDLPLSYLEHTGTTQEKPPLVIFLHGYGSNELDLFGLKDLLPQQYTYLSVRAPLTLGPGRYQWFRAHNEDTDYNGDTGDLKRSQQRLADFVAKATAKYQTDPNRVVVVGFSQGAMMSYELALREPALVRGIAALSGKILPVVRTEVSTSPALQALAVFIGHGTADQRVQYWGATQAVSFLAPLKITPQVHSYPGMGHSISETEVIDLRLWLQKLLGA